MVAVTHIASGSRSAGGTTTVAPAYPSGVAAGRLAIASRVIKPSTATGTAESGWTQRVSQTGGTGTQGIDTGPSRVVVDTRLLDGSESGSVTFDNASSPDSSHGIIQIYSATGTFDIVTTTGDDASHGTGRNATGGAIALAPGDVLVAILASDTDTSTAFTGVSTAISAPGITFGTTSQRLPAGGVATGQDCGLHVYEATVSSGTATAAPSIALTGGPSNCGPVAFLRLRAVAIPGAAAATFGFTASASGVAGAPTVTGQAAAALGFAATSSGIPRTSGQALVSFGFAGVATGIPETFGVAASSFGFTGAAAGVPRTFGAAVASIGFAGAATGLPRHRGAALVTFGFAAAASGVAGSPPVLGQASSTFGFAAQASGVDRVLGMAVVSFGFDGSVAGVDRTLGVAVMDFGFTTIANGVDGALGPAVADFGFAAEAAGSLILPTPTPAARTSAASADARSSAASAAGRSSVANADPRRSAALASSRTST